MTKFHSYELTYDNDDTECVEIRLELADATNYYLNQSVTYWCGDTNSEKSHTVISIEEIN